MNKEKKSRSVATGGEKVKASEIKKAQEKRDQDARVAELVTSTIGKNRSFAMTEAHKRLRTNVMFSFADDENENNCRIIGVTSAVAHEGKSTTSINLAYDLMKAGKKTLLIDADMRLSKVSGMLDVQKAPGLSNLLVGQNSDDLVQHSPCQDGLSVITCGNFPPNPTELLASKRFELMLKSLREVYEYIIIDLPPVIEVSDALIASKHVDGMIIVVRQEYVDKRLIDDVIHQLQHGGVRIIGFVMTCVHYGGKYGKYAYKKYGGKKYGKKYGYKKYYSSPYSNSSTNDMKNKG